jgi:hypothetical protein
MAGHTTCALLYEQSASSWPETEQSTEKYLSFVEPRTAEWNPMQSPQDFGG